MSDNWMPLLQLPLTREQFDQLPRHAAYRYDYIDGIAWLNPRPRFYHARLTFDGLTYEATSDVPVRPLNERDWEPLGDLFAESFRAQQPFCGQPPGKRAVAARASLLQTRTGGDGPLIEEASFVARGEDGALIGCILVTLLPLGDPTDWDTYYWLNPPPRDCVESCFGQPHLTWIFVHPDRAGRGVGTSLLRAAVGSLSEMGYRWLLSTFLAGNESSMLWHWRVGFELLCYPSSPRRYFPAR